MKPQSHVQCRIGTQKVRGWRFEKQRGTFSHFTLATQTKICHNNKDHFFHTQRYRSGHNGADSKSVCGQPHVGSNPTRCAKKRTAPPQGGAVLLSGWDSKPERVSGVKKTCRWHVFSREVRSSYAAKRQKPLLTATANAVSSCPRLQNTICKCIMNYNLCLI